jgi:hypothetical protein
VSLLALIRGGAGWVGEQVAGGDLPPVVSEAVRVTLAPGESVYLDAAALASARAEVLAVLETRAAETQQRIAEEAQAGLDPIFAAAEAGVPAFADWYYSLAGEYSRLAAAAFGDLTALLTERLEALIFAPADTAAALDALDQRLGAEAVAAVQAGAQEARDLLAELARATDLPPGQVRIAGDWSPGEALGGELAPFTGLTPEDLVGHGAAASAGAAAGVAAAHKLGGAAVAKAAGSLAAKPSAGAAAALVAKLGLKSAVKAGGALGAAGTGAATGAAVCAGTVAGAPIAPACALVGGVVTGVASWLLIDKAVIEADEHLHREAFEADLRAALAEQREALAAELAARYGDGAAAALAGLREGLSQELNPRTPARDFVPGRPSPGM